MSIIGSQFWDQPGLIGRAVGQRGLRTVVQTGLRAMLIGLASLEPMAASCLLATEPHGEAADEAPGRG